MSGNLFTRVKLRKPPKSTFDLSFENKFTMKFGQLTPFMCQEVLPGDKFKVGENHLIRLAPTLAPLMNQVNVFMHYFFVPTRLIWDEWEDFITRGAQGNLSPHYPLITRGISGETTESVARLFEHGSLADYLNFPTLSKLSTDLQPPALNHNVSWDALPFRAYQLIYNEYYRDQNVTAELNIDKSSNDVTDDNDIRNLMSLRNRAWHHDYFTSALPWPQRNAQGVPFPITGEARVRYDNTATSVTGPNGDFLQGNLSVYDDKLQVDGFDAKATTDASVSMSDFRIPTITEFRRAFRLQEWLEKSAVGGSRYIEQILAHFGVRSSDARLQRPEYLCGLKAPIIMSQVQQTSASTEIDGEVSPLGVLGGNGTSISSQFAFSRHFEEHGYIIGIMSVIPKAAYFQGLPRKFSRRNWDDFYWPEFANIGEQPILNQEIFYEFGNIKGNNEGTFGYTPRYAEYRFNASEIHGEFRGNLDFWHLARKFNELPPLNNDFLTYDNSNVDRVLAVSSDLAAPLYVQIHNRISATRKIPKFAENYI